MNMPVKASRPLAQRLAIQLMGVRQAYQLADAALRGPNPPELLILDCPPVLNRSMVPPREAESYAAYRAAYERAVDSIQRFWAEHRHRLFPCGTAQENRANFEHQDGASR